MTNETDCERNCSHILSSYSTVYFQRFYCTFSKNSLSFDPCRVNFFLQFCSFFALCSKFGSLFDSVFFGLVLFYNHSKSQEPFLWNLLFSFLLQLRFYLRRLDELVYTLQRYYFWLVYHSTFQSGKCLRSLEITRDQRNFVVHILKGTQLPLSLASEGRFRTRVGDMPAASSKV